MSEEPPSLVFAPSIERPPAAAIERLQRAPTSFIVDAMGGSGDLDWRVKPIVGKSLVGVALTCDCGPGDNLSLIAATARSLPGDVLVAATGGFTGAAVVGDLLLGIARNRGVVGIATDGLVRDLADLEALNLPVYATGVTPNSPGKLGPAVGFPIVCGGQTVSSGDSSEKGIRSALILGWQPVSRRRLGALDRCTRITGAVTRLSITTHDREPDRRHAETDVRFDVTFCYVGRNLSY
jgi:4-hydroxy-4-methyl-2-oxoglutarate aldolase